jgi:hypothetical protein
VTDLVEFLRAQLDADEQFALLACAGRSGSSPNVLADGAPIPWRDDHRNVWVSGRDSAATAASAGIATHIARHDPARVLREVEAKRRIIDRCVYLMGWTDEHDPQVTEHEVTMMRAAGSEMLRDLAALFAGEPGYKEAWAV